MIFEGIRDRFKPLDGAWFEPGNCPKIRANTGSSSIAIDPGRIHRAA